MTPLPHHPTTSPPHHLSSYFPLKSAAKAAAQDGAPVAARAGTPGTAVSPSAKLRNLRILVVEDEQNIRCFLARALTQLGHSPRADADAQEGLAALSEERFDLVFTDLGLPGMSGEELARTIAQKSPATPVVLLTGWSSQLKDEAQPLTGVTRILDKPITLSTLSSTIEAVCQGNPLMSRDALTHR